MVFSPCSSFLLFFFLVFFVANLSYSCIVLFTAEVYDHNGKITCTYRSTPCPQRGRVMRLLLAKWKFEISRVCMSGLPRRPRIPDYSLGSRHFIISPSPRRAPANRLDALLGLRQRAFPAPSMSVYGHFDLYLWISFCTFWAIGFPALGAFVSSGAIMFLFV